MTTPALRWLATALAALLTGCNCAHAETADSSDIILPTDPRFEVFELSNAAGDGTHASSAGTVLLSFVSKHPRYCRAARFPADRTVVLACRDERGWKIEARSRLSPADSTSPTAFGGGGMHDIGAAVEDLRASPDLLDESEIIEAASKGWLNPLPFDKKSLDAPQILKRTHQVYRASKSYIDTGIVQTVYVTQSGERTGETYFKTAYVAPFDFRFESKMNDFGSVEVHFIVGNDENGVEAWLSSDPALMRDISSIQKALDAGAGISRDSSGMIAGMFFPGTKLGGDIVRLTSAVRLEDAEIDGVDCFQVQGFRWPNTGRPTTVWIEKERFLIRRVYEEQEMKDLTTKTTWSYKPAINVPVREEALRFAETSQ